MTGISIVLGMIVFWSILLTIIFRLEKRMVWPYGKLESAPQVEDPSGYSRSRVVEAQTAGFTLLGWAPDAKGSNYRVSYAMLFSAERDVFVIIGVGKVINIPVATTWIYTPTSDARCFYSTDKQTGVQIDVSRNWTNQLVPSTTFMDLLRAHREWVRNTGAFPRSFTHGRELEEFRVIRQEHYHHMKRAGLVDFIDAGASQFRFTLAGAARTAISGYFLGMSRQLTGGRVPRNA